MRYDLQVVASLVEEGSHVLDLGCGQGELLLWLTEHRGVTARGVEISEEAVRSGIAGGLSVYHGDIDEGLADYADNSFDLVILSQTLQMVRNPHLVMDEMLRVGRQAIVSFPNFGHWSVRLHLLLQGRAPRTPSLPYEWYNTPNIRVLTIRDFHNFCAESGITILKEIPIVFSGSHDGRIVRLNPNLTAQYGIYLVTRAQP
ncbi:MAG: methionine biosynthesis protein MetW [bacterium]|nr:methionine biosynthesis protein MetW [bacterium]